MSIKLVATDLDGTLIDTNNFIPKKNMDAIASIHDKHVNFAICTGKTYSITKDICKKCNASYGIFGNGTQIINLQTGEEIYKSLLSLYDFNICYKIAKQHNLHVHVYTNNEIITPKLEYMDLRNYILNGSKDTDSLHFLVIHDLHSYINKNKSQIFKLVISSVSSLDKIKTSILDKLDLSINHIKKTRKI